MATALSDAELLRAMFDAAVAAADPGLAVPRVLPAKPPGRVFVVGGGKASARMAQAVEEKWGPCEGLVIVPHGAKLPTQGIEIVEAAHPVPDQAGSEAAQRMLAMVESLGEGDMALCLISGGGSSLMAAPGLGLSLADKQAINAALLASGAPIGEMNVVRKHLSAVKGGRLAAAAYPALVMTLTISDVPGDDPSIIASGPTVPDASTVDDARAIIARYRLSLPPTVAAFLDTDEAETPKSNHPVFAQAETHLVAAPQASLEAAADVARAHGVTPLLLGDALEGEARELGTVFAGIAASCLRHAMPARPPVVLISGGETTVTVKGSAGQGGRNSEFLLSFAMKAPRGVSGIACDTDGIDGKSDAAGAIWTREVAQAAIDLDPASLLAGHDSYSFFEAAGGLVKTGPTHTNVNDFRAILIR
jgi:glycerate-2-kinase